MKYKYIVFVSAIFLLFLSACHVSKRIVEQATQKTLKPNEIYDGVLKNEPKFHSMDISKLSINVTINEQSFNIKGFLRLITDSAIIISAQPLPGIEVARVYISPDSLVVLNRMSAEYYTVSMDSLKQKTGLDFDFKTIQSLLSNKIFLSGIEKNQVSKQMFDVSLFPDGYDLKATEQKASFNQDFIINPQLRIEKATIIDKTNPYSLTCEYSNFTQVDSFTFPHKMKFSAFDGNKIQNLEINITKVEFDTPINMNFSIPDKYTKGDISNFKL